jgi:hypothetical protein
MTRADELLVAVEKLSVAEQAEFVRRFHRWENDDWDKQMIADHEAGKLDSLIAEAREEGTFGLTTRPAPR